ncbi:hypothetical protein Tco_1247303 [Tanacetum coccineum]
MVAGGDNGEVIRSGSDHRTKVVDSMVGLSLLIGSDLGGVDLDIPICANILEWYDWLDVVRVAAMARSALEGIGGDVYFVLYGTNSKTLILL